MEDPELQALCAWCDKRKQFSWNGRKLSMEYHEYPYYDHPRSNRRVCEGSGKNPIDHLEHMTTDLSKN